MSYHTSHTLSIKATPSTWGRIRNIDATYDNAVLQVTNRGYTGHEHLLSVALVNMNGRMYDPLLGRMLSPDNYTQAVDMTQNFNRYSYALNNPLKYTDPDGEWVHLVVGAAIGGTLNWLAHGADFTWEGLGYFAIGAAAGAIGGVAGQAIAGSVGAIGFAGGAMTGAGSGFVGGFATGAGNSWMGGASFGSGLVSGVKTGGFGALTGGIIGGVSGGITAVNHGGKFWSGKGATFEFSSSFQVDGESSNVEYSTKSAKEFSSQYIGDNPRGLNELYADGSVPEGYSLVDGLALSPEGDYAQGLTLYLGKGQSDVYLFEAAFKSHEQLYLVMRHEYMHVSYFNNGLMNYNKQEAGARQWMLEQGKAWNYKLDRLQYNYDQYSRYLSQKYYYSRLGVPILNTRPW